MAVRPILSIDVRDGQFRDFLKLYEKYDKALKSSPAAWKLVTQNIDGSRQSFNKLVDQMAAANVQEKLREKAQERADKLTRTSAERWQAMARNTKEFARNISDATVSLLKWGSVTGVISGLIGAGGLFGLDRLALGAASSRRGALGIGASIGGQEAFKANFGRLVDPDSFLQGVAGAKFDIRKRTGLISAGLSKGQIEGDTANAAVVLLDKLKQIADTTNPALYAQVLQARLFDQFASPTDLERLHNTSGAEYEQLKAGYRSGRSRFNVEDDVAKKWQDLATQLDVAGKSIETTLIKGLANLAPGITKLSESFAKVAGVLLEKGGPIEQWVTKLDGALEKFAGYVGTEDFQKNVRDFVNGIAKIASAIGGAIGWLGEGSGGAHISDRVNWAKHHRSGLKTRGELRAERAAGKSAWSQLGDIFSPNRPLSEDDLLAMVRKREGGTPGQANAWGAIGTYQIKPAAGADVGFSASDLYDEKKNEAAARALIRKYAKQYHMNVPEILAAYNQGEQGSAAFRAHGDDPRYLKPEGQKYIQGTNGMRVVIENNTGGNAIISTNALKN